MAKIQRWGKFGWRLIVKSSLFAELPAEIREARFAGANCDHLLGQQGFAIPGGRKPRVHSGPSSVRCARPVMSSSGGPRGSVPDLWLRYEAGCTSLMCLIWCLSGVHSTGHAPVEASRGRGRVARRDCWFFRCMTCNSRIVRPRLLNFLRGRYI